MFDRTLSGALKLLFDFHALKSFIVWRCTLTPTVSYIMSLFPTIYTSSVLKPFLLLQSLLKCLSLLKSLVQPLLPRSTPAFSHIVSQFIVVSIAPYIISLLPIIYISSILKLFFLLQSPLKCLSLLKSLVWPLLPRSTFIFSHIMF